MKINKRIIKEYSFDFDKEEFKVIRKCLIYCLHRINKHDGTGIEKALDFIQIRYLKDLKKELYNHE